jgi:hypothetical protein
MTYDAFISYSRRDSEVAGRIQEHLTGAGLVCYRDVTDIPGSDRWVEAITEAIERSHVIVAILSGNSVVSDHARREIHFTIGSNKPIVPVLLSRDLALPKVWQFYLSELQYLFADQSLEDALPRIAEAAGRVIDRSRHKLEYDDEADVLRRGNYDQKVEPAGGRLGLPQREFPEGVAGVEGGAYVLQSRPGQFFGHRMDALPVTSEFVFEAQVAKTTGPDEECFGFEFGAGFPGDYYQFLLNGAGILRISRHLEGRWSDLVIAPVEHRASAAGGANLLKVVRKGEAIHVFVNDLHVASTNDFTVRTGRPGLVVGRDIRVEFSRVGVRGVGLEAVFRNALDCWSKLETRAAKESLEYVARYDSGFRVSDWLDAGSLLREIQPDRHHSVLIVIGAWAVAQFNDGVHAERLRDRINRRGRPHPFRWAAIVTDTVLMQDPRFLECPLIAVGGPAANQITTRLQEQLPRVAVGRENISVQHNIGSGDRRMALWGPLAADTAEAVEYAISSGLLDEFLKTIWRG